MNANGLALLERVLAGDVQVIKLIDRCAMYARAKKDVELIQYRSFKSGKDVYAEQVSAYLLSRLLNNLT